MTVYVTSIRASRHALCKRTMLGKALSLSVRKK